MLTLVLLVTVPVLVGLGGAGFVGSRAGRLGIWISIATVLSLSVAMWGMRVPAGTPALQRFGAGLAIYAPPLALGAAILTQARLTAARIGIIAVLGACANVFLAQFFFVLGCANDLWVCP